MWKLLTLAALAGVAAAVPLGTAQAATRPAFRIDQSGIGAARLGQPAAAYVRLFGTPRRDRIDGGYDRLVFPAQQLAVLFRPGSAVAVGIVSSSPRYTTNAGIGPCSATASLRGSYGARVERVATGPMVEVERLGRIGFAVDSDGLVRATVVADPADVDALVALAVPPCGSPAV